jgi:tetratricopeptide (TPR) repeat protein
MFWKRFARQPSQPSASATEAASTSPPSELSLSNDLHADLGEALRWLARGAEGELSGVSRFLHDLTKALHKAGLTQDATRVAAEARKLIPSIQREPTQQTRGEAFFYVLKALAITERAEEITKILADVARITRIQFTAEDISGSFMAISESVLDDTDDVRKAQVLISSITDSERKGSALGHLCKTLVRLGRLGEALELATQISDEPPHYWRSFFLSQCVETLCKLGVVDDALGVAKQISRDAFRSTALFAGAQSLADLGRIPEAEAVLEQAMTIPEEGRSGQEFAFGRAAKIQAILGHVDEALEMASHIERQRPRYSSAIAEICRMVASKGQCPQALALASKADNRDVALVGVVEGLASAGLLIEAENVLNQVKAEEQRWDGWEALGLKLASEAKGTEAIKAANRFPGQLSYRGDRIIASLVLALSKEGKYSDARRVIVQRWRSDPISRVEAMTAIWSASQAVSQNK